MDWIALSPRTDEADRQPARQQRVAGIGIARQLAILFGDDERPARCHDPPDLGERLLGRSRLDVVRRGPMAHMVTVDRGNRLGIVATFGPTIPRLTDDSKPPPTRPLESHTAEATGGHLRLDLGARGAGPHQRLDRRLDLQHAESAVGIRAEHEAVRSRVGVFDVSHMGEVEVSGPELHHGVDAPAGEAQAAKRPLNVVVIVADVGWQIVQAVILGVVLFRTDLKLSLMLIVFLYHNS